MRASRLEGVKGLGSSDVCINNHWILNVAACSLIIYTTKWGWIFNEAPSYLIKYNQIGGVAYWRASFHESRGISFTTAKDIIKDKLVVFFDNLSKLGTHSLRSGGASDPCCQSFSDISMQSRGGWNCVQSKKKYIKPTAAKQFEVSNNLPIWHDLR